MCVAATAKRRRRQMKFDKRFKVRDNETSSRRAERARQAETQTRGRKRK